MPYENVRALAEDNPAVVEGRTVFPNRQVWPGVAPRVLKSGAYNRKIGSRVVKGPWAGMPIYTLTLEERATCPRSCDHWRDCYGNHMQWPDRLMPGRALEHRLGRELRDYAQRNPGGFVVRLHVLGDFYSVDYVRRWASWLRRFPQLRVFGYTAWPPDTPVGALVADVRDRWWGRFAVRTSGDYPEKAARTAYSPIEAHIMGETVCPAQTGGTEGCGTCGLCWHSKKNVVFLAH